MSQVVRKQGATWVHEVADASGLVVRTLCGLGITASQSVVPLADALTCPGCIEERDRQARIALTTAVPPHEFRPKTGEIALAWAGPRVEILTVVDDGEVQVTVFLDGREVPCTHVTHHKVDPGDATEVDEWNVDTGDVTRDVTLSEPYRELLVAERDAALQRAS